METHQLRYFVAVAEEGSFSHAAEREHVSQPSLSQQIHKVEEELNQQLFDRLPRSVVLSEACRVTSASRGHPPGQLLRSSHPGRRDGSDTNPQLN